jgi:hypothetical protein
MPTKAKQPISKTPDSQTAQVLWQHAEEQFAQELEELIKADTRQRPPN